MKERSVPVRMLALALLIIAALALAGCGPRGPEGAAEEQAAAEEPAAAEESTTAEEPAAEATEAPAEEAAAETDDAVSAPDQPVEQKLGGTWCTDEEDVSTPRENLGGEYRDVASSDAVSFHPALTTDTASSGYQAMVYAGSLLQAGRADAGLRALHGGMLYDLRRRIDLYVQPA